MKVVLSRKCFDSSYGGIPSPILPDGRLLPLPIPSRSDNTTFQDLGYDDVDLGKIVSDLSRQKHSINTCVHLDPDLGRRKCDRMPGWRPALGQTGSAQGHLQSMGVGPGDIFLFFGWFRRSELYQGVWRYAPSAPNMHVIFGWLEIEAVLPVVTDRDGCLEKYPWIQNHAHVVQPGWYSNERNTLYVTTEQSSIVEQPSFGGGVFSHYCDDLRLTKPGCSRTVWSLPHWFLPNGRPPLSYHGKQERWEAGVDDVTLKSVAKGQEFVIDGAYYPELAGWVSRVVTIGTRTA